MKRITTIALTALFAITLFAQPGVIGVRNEKSQGDKILTMEEAILGYNLSPANKLYQWRGPLNELITIENNTLVSTLHGKNKVSTTLISLDELNQITGLKLTSFPRFAWLNENEVLFNVRSRYFRVDVVNKSLSYSFHLPREARNFTPSPAASIQEGDMHYFAYTKSNNLYICDSQGNETAISTAKNPNIIYGQSVSRNEFGISGGIFWSDNGQKLAFYRKDESRVGEYPLLDINSRTGGSRMIKYPMAGMASEYVQLGVYDMKNRKIVYLKVNDFDTECYLTNISWTPDGESILVQVLDRAQKNMHLNLYSAVSGEFVKTILTEHNDRFVEPQKPVVFLENDPSKFLYDTDNRDGYRNLYLCDLNGKIDRLTKVDANVSYAGQDKKHVYYTSAEVSPIENHLFKITLDKKRKVTRLTTEEGMHSVSLSGDCTSFLDSYSNITVPRVVALKSTDISKKKFFAEVLFEAEDPVKEYNYGEIVLGSVKSADGRFDNYYRLIKPADFDPEKKYPVIVYVYGGPHSQMVNNSFLAQLRRWEMYMAQRGYVVYCQDNRGTQNRGAEFEKAIYGQCGVAEMEDQMEGIKMLKSLPYVDADRIGVHGWSYGGFMTISLMTTYPDVFKVGVAGGPVIDWKWYEVMYGERYMGHPDINKEGYAKTSLINKAKDLKGKLLICQGVIDNTVVWQHSLNFVEQCIVNNIQVDYFPYPNHEHNVIGPQRVHLMDKVSIYFNDYL